MTVASALPPAERISSTTASSLSRVRPAIRPSCPPGRRRRLPRAADRPSPSVDHRVLVLKQHSPVLHCPSAPRLLEGAFVYGVHITKGNGANCFEHPSATSRSTPNRTDQLLPLPNPPQHGGHRVAYDSA